MSEGGAFRKEYTCSISRGKMSSHSWWAMVVVGVGLVVGACADVNIMKDITLGFGQALEQCREESGLSDEKMEDIFHYWRDDFKFENRELGCAILCMSKHFNLLTDSSRMHHENTDKFIKSFPNGEVISKKMVEMIHGCEQQFNDEADHCWRILHVAECFKMRCKETGLAPSIQQVVAEIIMEADAN